MAIPRRPDEADTRERRSFAIPVALLLLALAAGVAYSALHALDRRHSDHSDAPPPVPLQPPAIIILTTPTATSTSASPTAPSSCAPIAMPSTNVLHAPKPVAAKSKPVPTHVDPIPPLPAPTTASPTVVVVPAPPTAASDIPLSPAKVVPVTMGSR